MQLYNIHDKKTLLEKLEQEPFRRATLSFYQYAKIDDPQAFRNRLFEAWSALGVLGRTYVSGEGINGQVNVPEDRIEEFKAYTYGIPFLEGIRLNFAIEDDGKSFLKLVIKVRDKIVADGIDDPDFDVTNCGTHLKADEFNAMAEKPDTIIVDMRNHYESEVGHFENAILPDVDTFREELPVVEQLLADKKDQPIVLYCTGGIRCEKASAYLKYKGFENVYQLEGGIIEYTRQAKNLGIPNKFKGKNFVFDERLGERISDEIISKCHQCGTACDDHTNCANDACHLLFIQCPECAANYEGCCTEACREFLHLPAEAQKEQRKGTNYGQNIYRKGRVRPKISGETGLSGDE